MAAADRGGRAACLRESMDAFPATAAVIASVSGNVVLCASIDMGRFGASGSGSPENAPCPEDNVRPPVVQRVVAQEEEHAERAAGRTFSTVFF